MAEGSEGGRVVGELKPVEAPPKAPRAWQLPLACIVLVLSYVWSWQRGESFGWLAAAGAFCLLVYALGQDERRIRAAEYAKARQESRDRVMATRQSRRRVGRVAGGVMASVHGEQASGPREIEHAGASYIYMPGADHALRLGGDRGAVKVSDAATLRALQAKIDGKRRP